MECKDMKSLTELSIIHVIAFVFDGLTCNPLHRVTAPIVRMWFQLKSRTCSVSFIATNEKAGCQVIV